MSCNASTFQSCKVIITVLLMKNHCQPGMTSEFASARGCISGGYYYHATEPGMNYEQTILKTYDYNKEIGIPYKYVHVNKV